MTDQPVTPDREAMIEAAQVAMHQPCVDPGRVATMHAPDAHARDATLAVDALLPLLTKALDRARQQGKREGRDEGLDDAYACAIVMASRTFGPDDENTPATEAVLATAKMIRERHSQSLARGGPNRKRRRATHFA